MKLRTSFFDKATFRKDLTRYWPVWLLYTVLLFAVLMPYMNFDKYDLFILERTMNGIVGDFAIYEMVYAGLMTALLFGDLFSNRSCYMLHAMPATRTARFVSHICAGLLACLIPHLLIALLWIPTFTPWGLGLVPLCFFGAISLQYLCFFGIAVFAVMCTGNRFAMAILYGILNFLSRILSVFVSLIFMPMLYGFTDTYAKIFNILSPVTQLQKEHSYVLYSYNGYTWDDPNLVAFDGFGDSWEYTFILAGVGVAMLLLAYGMYRRRKLETAGDFIATAWLKPVFLVLFTLCMGAIACKSDLVQRVQEQIPFMIGGMVIGFFSGKMMLERTFKIFRLRSFIQFGVLAVACVLTVYICQTDPMGIVDYVPETEEIASVTFNSSKELTQTDKIEMVQEVHRWILQEKCDGRCGNNHERFSVTYTLKNGRTVNRFYHLCLNKETNFLRTWLNVTEYFLTQEDVEVVKFFLDGVQFRDFSYNERWVIWHLQQWILKTRCDGNCGSKHSTLSFTYHDKKVIEMSFTYQLCINQETESLLGILRYYNDPYSPSPEQFYRVIFTEVDKRLITQKSRYETTTTEGIAAYVQVYEWALEHACGEECGAEHTLYTVNFYSHAYATCPVYTFRLCDNEENRAMLELLKTYDNNA